MQTIGIRQLRDRLTAHVREIQKGVAYILTSRGKPVAVLRPISPADLAAEDAGPTLALLEAEGKIRRGRGKIGARVLRPRRAGTSLSAIVMQDRR